jgi:hypothetical protein
LIQKGTRAVPDLAQSMCGIRNEVLSCLKLPAAGWCEQGETRRQPSKEGSEALDRPDTTRQRRAPAFGISLHEPICSGCQARSAGTRQSPVFAGLDRQATLEPAPARQVEARLILGPRVTVRGTDPFWGPEADPRTGAARLSLGPTGGAFQKTMRGFGSPVRSRGPAMISRGFSWTAGFGSPVQSADVNRTLTLRDDGIVSWSMRPWESVPATRGDARRTPTVAWTS